MRRKRPATRAKPPAAGAAPYGATRRSRVPRNEKTGQWRAGLSLAVYPYAALGSFVAANNAEGTPVFLPLCRVIFG